MRKRRDWDHLLKDLSLEEAKILNGRRILLKERVWIERTWRGIKMFEWKWNRVDPQIYMDPDILIDREGVERCQEQNPNRSRRYYREWFRASIKQIENLEKWLNGSGYVSRGIEKNPENFNRRNLYQEVSSIYQASYGRKEEYASAKWIVAKKSGVTT